MMMSVLFLLFVVFATKVKTDFEEIGSEEFLRCYVCTEGSHHTSAETNLYYTDCVQEWGRFCFIASKGNKDKLYYQGCGDQGEVDSLKGLGYTNFKTCNDTMYCNRIED